MWMPFTLSNVDLRQRIGLQSNLLLSWTNWLKHLQTFRVNKLNKSDFLNKCWFVFTNSFYISFLFSFHRSAAEIEDRQNSWSNSIDILCRACVNRMDRLAFDADWFVRHLRSVRLCIWPRNSDLPIVASKFLLHCRCHLWPTYNRMDAVGCNSQSPYHLCRCS